MNLKKMAPAALLIVIVIVAAIIAVSLGLIGSEYGRWLPVFVGVGLFAVFFMVRRRSKTQIEKFYDAVIAGTAANEKGSLGHPDDNLRLKPLKLVGERPLRDGGSAYSFKLPVGMSRSHYERYREGLEQYLNSNVRFSFDENLIITVLDGPLVKYK